MSTKPRPRKHPKLKPCPFCGSPAKICRDNGWESHRPATISIRCSNDKCGRAGTVGRETMAWAPGKGTYSVLKDALKDVIAQWEERTPPKIEGSPMSTDDFDVVRGKPPAKGGPRLGRPAFTIPPREE